MDIDQLLEQLLKLQEAERQRVLSELPSERRTQVESLLANRPAETPAAETVIFATGKQESGSGGFSCEASTEATVVPLPFTRNLNSKAVGTFADYELLGEIARGGMGVVFKARHRELNRIVALKMILSGAFADPTEISRFRIEAQAAAKLSHSGIVPVFDTGEQDGCHYFSMAFVDGGSLSQRLQNGPLPPREAAELLMKLAEAIAYAHENGVVHRDLKPGNVLLDEHGEPKITDFGLAMRTDLNSGMTQSGAIMGTPSYMSPEQAAGRVHDVGPHSDTYALGAILYCLLTGVPPFRGSSSAELLNRVINDPPPPLKSAQGALPFDLQTICLHCLEKNPQDRYATANDLAEDLSRYLNNYPIHARPIRGVTKLWRWSQRNTTLVALICVSVLSVVVGGFLKLNSVATHLRTAQKDLSKLVEQVFKEHAAGDRYFEQEMSLPSFAFQNLNDSVREFENAEQAYRFYFFGSTDQDLLYNVATAKFYIGQARRLQSRHEEAETAFQDAIARFLALVESDPTDQKSRLRASVAWDYLAELYREQNRRSAAEAAYRESLRLQAGINVTVTPEIEAAMATEQLNFQQEFARTHNNYAILLLAMGRAEESRENFNKAHSLLARLIEQQPTDASIAMDHARTLLNLGHHEEIQGHAQVAVNYYESARQHIADMVTEYPKVPRYRFILAVSEKNQGWVLGSTTWEQDPQAKVQQGRQLLNDALQNFGMLPELPQYTRRYATCRNNLAIVHGFQNEWRDARDEFQRAQSLALQLVRDDPRSASCQSILGRIHGGLAWVARNLKEPGQAKDQVRAAIQHQTAAWEISPADYWTFLSDHHLYLAELLMDESAGHPPDPEAAVAEIRAAIGAAPSNLQAEEATRFARLLNAPFSRLHHRADFKQALTSLGVFNPLAVSSSR